ncbi:metalloregulator ArsR/SmtB family transcription factor [Frankia sp. QA3]|uniref:ArsR/SmtB family transcription factor n=1 Tax=Frankia sp. QA3 TaxID=710111 RepID=UPI000269BF1D|nr:metalloregulator ArsR/SmtB family transcription factor [Frankia sp. QA3]EIV91486.1 putative transcriptional regulator [Frankia sp. QA3]
MASQPSAWPRHAGAGTDQDEAGDVDGDVDGVFRALADPHRRLLLDRLDERGGQSLRELCAGLDMTRQSVSKHLAVLVAAGLVTTRWRGREKLHHLNAAPIDAIAGRWISRYHRERVRTLTDLTTALESEPVSSTEFVYITYINTTPQRLWQALTDPAFTLRYWGAALESDWQVGSPVVWRQGEVTIADAEQVVLAAEPPRRLSYTWHTFTPEFAAAFGFADEFLATVRAERRSRVVFDLEPVGRTVKLTVVHTDFDPGSTVLESISGGWPAILSNLKTLLETGQTLPAGDQPAGGEPGAAPDPPTVP